MAYGVGTHPDVFISETSSPQTSGAPSTQNAAVGAMVSIFQKGAIGKPLAVQSFSDAQNQLGNFLNSSFGMYSLQALFAKGGDTLTYVCRTVHYNLTAAFPTGSVIATMPGGGTANSATSINVTMTGATTAVPVGTAIRVRGQIGIVSAASTTSPNSPTLQLLTLYYPLPLGVPSVGMSVTDVSVLDLRQSAPSQVFVSDQGGITKASPQYAFQFESISDGTFYNNIQLIFVGHPILTTTLNASGTAGATSITLTSVTGLKVGMQLLIGVAGGSATAGEYKTIVGFNGLTVNLSAPLANSYSTGAAVVEQSYDLSIFSSGARVEFWQQLSSGSAAPNYMVATLNSTVGGSQYVNVTDLGSTNVNGNVPNFATYTMAAGLDGINNPITGSSMMTDADYIGVQSLHTGLYAFDGITDYVLNPCVPGVTTTNVYAALTAYATNRADNLALLDSPLGSLPANMVTLIGSSPAILFSYAAMYYPWVMVPDPIGAGYNPTKLIPPCGPVLGAYVASDKSRGFYKAPAGTSTKLIGAIGLEYKVTNNDHNLLNPIGVNCIRQFPGLGIIVDGAKTLSVSVGDTSYDTVPVRRMFLSIEKDLVTGAREFEFEPNNANLLNQLYLFCYQILLNRYNQGWFVGSSTDAAFQIILNTTNNGAQQQAQDSVVGQIGIATVRPAEFIYFNIGYNAPGTLSITGGS